MTCLQADNATSATPGGGGCTSGYEQYSDQRAMAGSDYQVTSEDHCRRLCNLTTNCVAYSYREHPGNETEGNSTIKVGRVSCGLYLGCLLSRHINFIKSPLGWVFEDC